jgi:hypothetical protein
VFINKDAAIFHCTRQLAVKGKLHLAGVDKKEKTFELAFVAGFSTLVFALFYSLLSSNGVVLGNDPAVHLQTAQYFLDVGRIPLSDVAWYTPLYHLVLDAFIAFTGITDVGQTLILMKAVTALIDWLVVFSVYIVCAKFLGKRTGVLASALLLLCFPLFELNAWGGYTSLLSIVFMALLLMYLALPLKGVGNTLTAFILAFSLVLSHQLATFLAVFILPPFIVVVLVSSRGHYSKALIAAVLGGAAAFLIYYVKPMLPYINQLVSIIFFELTTMLYQVPFVSFSAFMTYFGFVLFFAFAGMFIAFFGLRRRKALNFYLLVVLAFLVPLFFSQSYLVGLLLPYQRFIYFMLPATAILAAATLSFVIDGVATAYFNNRAGWKRVALKVFAVGAVVLLAAVMVVRFDTVSGKIGESTTFYATSDVEALEMGAWVNQAFPDPDVMGVVMQKPGHWFTEFSGHTVIAQTDPVIEWNVNAECVLALSYELSNPLTLVRVYEAKSNVSEENYAMVNMVWRRLTYEPLNYSYISYQDPKGVGHSYALSSLNRSIAMEADNPNQITVAYEGADFVLTQAIRMENDSYPVTTTWQLTALDGV